MSIRDRVWKKGLVVIGRLSRYPKGDFLFRRCFVDEADNLYSLLFGRLTITTADGTVYR